MRERLPKDYNPEFPKEGFNFFQAQALVVAEMLVKGVNQKDDPEYHRQLDLLWARADEIAQRYPKQKHLSVGHILVESLEELETKREDLKPGLKVLKRLALKNYGISLT